MLYSESKTEKKTKWEEHNQNQNKRIEDISLKRMRVSLKWKQKRTVHEKKKKTEAILKE